MTSVIYTQQCFRSLSLCLCLSVYDYQQLKSRSHSASIALIYVRPKLFSLNKASFYGFYSGVCTYAPKFMLIKLYIYI